MSGFLRNLAAQAINSGHSSLHTMAKIPYASQPTAPLNQELGLVETPESLVHGADNNQAMTGQNQSDDSFKFKIAAQDHVNQALPTSSSAQVAQPAAGFNNLIAPKTAPPTSIKSRPGQADKTANSAVPVLDAGKPSHSGIDNPVTNSSNNKVFETTFIDSMPPLLLPLQNPPTLKAETNAQVNKNQPGNWQSQLAETTEVHVSIGRIEVTAVHAAPAPKRPAATMAKPMSLDEYLARRQRQP